MSVAADHPLWEQFQSDLQSVDSVGSLSEVRDKYLSRQRGLLTLELKELGRLPKQERPAAGQRLNQVRQLVESALGERLERLRSDERSRKIERETVDVTMPGHHWPLGTIHPLRRLQQEMESIFVRMGFEVVTGPEIETDYYNFEALNIPRGHPARDDQDTFYLNDALLLRTHTSPVQIRTLEKRKPPVRMISPGRVFRRDAVDATHSPMFHQMEALVVDEAIGMGHLKGTLETFFQQLFGEGTLVRFRPSFFPFVEPGAEVDVSCIFCAGSGCRICKGTGWIEVLGAGMVHPEILKRVGCDPDRWTGFAFGIGIDRIALLRYQVDDLRLFFENDIRFLRQF